MWVCRLLILYYLVSSGSRSEFTQLSGVDPWRAPSVAGEDEEPLTTIPRSDSMVVNTSRRSSSTSTLPSEEDETKESGTEKQEQRRSSSRVRSTVHMQVQPVATPYGHAVIFSPEHRSPPI